MQLFLQGIKQIFKYHISMLELYYHEQWTEKNFVLNVSKFIF
jgi:hypothetical protein